MSEPLDDLAAVINDALGMLKRVKHSLDDHRESSSQLLTTLGEMLSLANSRIDEVNQRRMLNERLLSALIEELVKAKAVSGEAVAGRFLKSVQSTSFLFQPPTLAEAKSLAERLTHPGFPDELPRPRGFGPTLIVDNDQSDS